MSTFLKQEFGVAMSGVKWDSGNFKLWQSTDPNIILFTPKQPYLAKGNNGRYQFGISQFRQQVDNTYKITGGSALFTITSAIPFTTQELNRLREEWMNEIRNSPQGRGVSANPRFIPLNVRNAEAQVLINSESGIPDAAHLERNIGTPGGYNSFLVKLTELGAQEWVQGVKTKSVIPAGVKIMYEYLRMLPTVGAEVKVNGRRLFQHLSADLKVSYKGFLYGGSAQISAAWEKMSRDGTIEITFIGGGLSPELETMRQELVSTFVEQARTQLFNSLFQAMPEVAPAQAGNTSGAFGGANFALKWKRVEETTNLNLTLKFEGLTWLKASMDCDLTSLIAGLDQSYINEVNTQMSAPATILVDADPLLENVAVSWSASEGKSPESPVFGGEGGQERFIVTSQKINDVNIGFHAKVNFTPPKWPIIEYKGQQSIKNGGNQVVIKPSAWVGRHYIYLFHRDGEQIVPASEEDYLVCNVSYTSPHLSAPIKESTKITGDIPLEFSYPMSPEGQRGVAKFSAFGVINGQFLRSRQEQVISPEEEAVFILVDSQRKDIQLVSQNSVFSESMPENSLEKRLMKHGARPEVSIQEETGSSGNGTGGSNSGGGGETNPNDNGGQGGQKLIKGTVIAVQYTKGAPSILVETGSGEQHKVHLSDHNEADPFNDGRRLLVEVEVGEDSFAKNITIYNN